jgi:DNA-binding Lrp family transcriptional regulator
LQKEVHIERSLEKKNAEKLKILFALIKGSRRSDEQLSKILGMSQTTVFRRRQELEDQGFINEYTVIPNFEKMGIEIVAFTFLKEREPLTPEITIEKLKWIYDQSEIVFHGEGEDSGACEVIVSMHKDYQSYAKLMKRLHEEPKLHFPLEVLLTVRVSTSKHAGHSKPFSLRYLERSLNV